MRRIVRWLLSHSWVYDLVQSMAGARQVDRRLAPLLADTSGRVVLDVGGGTGRLGPLLSLAACYICLDTDLAHLQETSERSPGTFALVGDARALPFADASVDLVACVAVAHHLSLPELTLALREMARVCGRLLVFLDALRVSGHVVGSLLWQFDRGRFPHTESELLAALSERFYVLDVECFAVYHRYWLCRACPKGDR